MKQKMIIILVAIAVVLTLSTFFLNIIPCKSWYGGNTGIADMMPHNTFCNLNSGTISFGPYNEYYYLTGDLTTAFLITLAIFLVAVFVVGFVVMRIKKMK